MCCVGFEPAVFMQINVELHAVCAHQALGKLVAHAVFGKGAALHEKAAAARLAVEQFALFAVHGNSLVRVDRVGGQL